MIDRQHFFEYVKANLFNKFKQSQIDGMNVVLDEWENDSSNVDIRYLSYMLATDYHETATTMEAIEEYGKGRGKKYGSPTGPYNQIYYGRGLVQLTWYDNYKKFEDLLKIPLTKNPSEALKIDVATKIMFIGMKQGLFTGKKLSDFFNKTKSDAINARTIINGHDKASLIAGYYDVFLHGLSVRA